MAIRIDELVERRRRRVHEPKTEDGHEKTSCGYAHGNSSCDRAQDGAIALRTPCVPKALLFRCARFRTKSRRSETVLGEARLTALVRGVASPKPRKPSRR